MSLIPIFGSILSSIPIVAIALVSSGHASTSSRGVYVLGWIIVIHLIEANFLNPKIMGDAAKIHPVLVVFALIAGRAQLRPGRRAVRGAGGVDHPDDLRLLPAPPAHRHDGDATAALDPTGPPAARI